MRRIEKLESLLVRSCKLLESSMKRSEDDQEEADALCEEIREAVKVD